ncbi:Methyltransferase type 11 [Beutenbergia cavernae DSM 12333]|uniref:Methyltransferase type 11 n=1 Tax=Beutenbergia cavernae (strain ATCC BAA-8 / DSM 12333 / CCUG 43141 / JCM 11478 / NBRC 16432 / NCIMB 13614 / HKI 0122) TaxID=471853 RepID=C5C3Y2_BEUC1|nr:class I SAM-dependent methyltransferase [Beutenbergia cavernae]ACQ79895.1 Methyltransferase type 11 [Beutenbergia cavernae DSM 12333]
MTVPFDDWVADNYERLWPELFVPSAIDDVVDVLEALAAGRPALELGIGTGRIAVPLALRGVEVHGIELSPPMARRVLEQPEGERIAVTIGDLAHVSAGSSFGLVYVVRNTITNLTTQDAQVAAFANAAAHLEAGGVLVVENYVPELRRLPPDENVHVFAATPTHVGYEEYDVAAQIAVSHHTWVIDGQVRSLASTHRFVWPAELDLMARMAGLALRERWADWTGTAFTSESRSHVSVWEKTA